MLSDLQLLASFRIYVARLKDAKQHEARLRVLVAERFFPSPHLGVNYQLDAGLKLTHKLNYSLGTADAVLGALAELTEQFPEQQFGDLIDWKPSLNMEVYKSLTVEQQNILGTAALTIKPAMPTVEPIEKDAKK